MWAQQMELISSISHVFPLQRRIAILCVGRGGLVNPVGLELPANRRRRRPRTSGREGVRAGPGTIIRDKILMKWVAINAPELPGTAF